MCRVQHFFELIQSMIWNIYHMECNKDFAFLFSSAHYLCYPMWNLLRQKVLFLFWVKVWNEFFGIIYNYFIISCTRIYGDFIAWNISVFTFVTVNVCIIYCKYNIAVVLIRIGPEITRLLPAIWAPLLSSTCIGKAFIFSLPIQYSCVGVG